MAPTLTGTPADLITYQRELVRTKNYFPLGRMKKVVFGLSSNWAPPADDPFIQKFERVIDLRSRWLPLGQSYDRTQLLVPAPLVDRSGFVGLPDVPDPNWKAEPWTPEERGYRPDGSMITDSSGRQVIKPRPTEKDTPRMVPQRLEDRCERPGGRLGYLEGTNFLVFQPVIGIVFQPEKDNQLQAQWWTIETKHDPATSTDMAMLIDPKTGETLFFGGRYDIVANEG